MGHSTYPERDYDFGQQILALRTNSNLIQSRLAELLGVSRQAIVGWESGTSYPSLQNLKHLIELCLQQGAFHRGLEAEEIRALWQSAHQRLPLDETWLAHVLEKLTDALATQATAPLAPVLVAEAPKPGPSVDWGDAPEVSSFYGREAELALLTDWLLAQRCRVVSLLGLGGIGKTLLAARLAQMVAPHFERAYWRSLRDAPPTGEWLAGAIGFLSDQQVVPPAADAERLAALLELLRTRRCLLVLDNFETLFEPGLEAERYRAGLSGYGHLLRMVGEASHQSCLVLTSREVPAELAILGGDAVRIFPLGGLGVDEARLVLSSKQLVGNPQQWGELTDRFGGNGLALKLVGERIRELFGGEIGLFLKEAGGSSVFGGVRQLLDEQVNRSSAPEQQLLRALAVVREPVRLADLLAALGSRLGRGVVLEAVEALLRRSLVERADAAGGVVFTLQSVVLEYVTDRLVEAVAEEIEGGQPALVLEQALVQATAKDYVRQVQERLIGMPLLDRLKLHLGQNGTGQRLLGLVEAWRGRPKAEQGYGPGNVVNLLRLLRRELRGIDLSRLAIRQAYLAQVDAQDARLVDAHLAETVLAEAFGFPGSVALDGGGALLAAGMSSGQVWLWRVADRTLLATLEGHTGPVFAVAFSADGHLLASGHGDGTVRLWEAPSGRPLATLEGHAGGVWGVALTAGGELLASGSADGTVRLWEAPSGRPLATLEGHTGGVWGVALSADGELLASGDGGGTVRLWNTSTGQSLATLEGHTGGVWRVALSADGDLLASGSADGTVRLWEAPGGRPLATLQGHTGVWGLALSADGHLLASSGGSGTVRLWEAPSGRPLATLQGHTSGVRGVALSADGHLLASGGLEGTVRLWEVPSGRPLTTLIGQTNGVTGIALSIDVHLVASGSQDGTVKLWEAPSGRPLAPLQGHSGPVFAVALSADGRLLTSGSQDGTVRLWEAPSGRPLATLQGHTGGVWGVALSADGHLLASGSADRTVRLWNTGTGQSLVTLEGHTGAVRGVALSADGHLLASGSADRTVRLWEAPSGRPLATLQGHSGPVFAVALSADGYLVASGSQDGMVRLWEAPSGRPLATLQGHTGLVWGVALSASGHLLASGGLEGMVRLWDTGTGQSLATLERHTGGVWGVALSADGHLLASGGWDGTVRLWETPSGAHVRTLQVERCYERLDISGLTGITDSQRQALLTLGAVENEASTSPEQVAQR
jgi:WD40 repeat protein/transcriptional regulator with XRE-family HTH domain